MFLLLLVCIGTIIMCKLSAEYIMEGRIKAAKTLYFIIILLNIILLIPTVADYRSDEVGLLSSMKCAFLCMDVIVVLSTPIIAKVRSNKATRILYALDGNVGDKLRAFLPSDAIVYRVDTYKIDWQKANSEEGMVFYSSLGFDKFPKHYEHVACQWLRDNIVYDKANYHFEKMTHDFEYVEKSNRMTIKKEHIDTYIIERDPDRIKSDQMILGHALVHNGYNFQGRSTKPLNKW